MKGGGKWMGSWDLRHSLDEEIISTNSCDRIIVL